MNISLLAFLGYTGLVLVLAWLSHRVGSGKSFISEYFLGSRSLGVIALALTFGATSASAGSFAGFPSLIYAHGWVLALWIASYMVFPLCAMGLLGKRLSQLSHRTGAVTVPDVLRERFRSPALAVLSTLLLALLLCVYLIPQFTLAALIMQQLLGSSALYQDAAFAVQQAVPMLAAQNGDPEYVLGLLIFAGLVIVYTMFGGFRAVVWTDVLQGFVMLAGVLIMLFLALHQVGGLRSASEDMQVMEPPELGTASFALDSAAPSSGVRIAMGTWFEDDGRLLRTGEPVYIPAGDTLSGVVKVTRIMTPSEITRIKASPLPSLPAEPRVHELRAYARGSGKSGTYMRAPGPSPSDPNGFLPIGLAISFFAFWAVAGTGQPSSMVRLMAFTGTVTLKRAIASLTMYFALIYFPLVIIFCCARLLVPGLDHTPDRIMPAMAYLLSDNAGIPWLAGFLIAAPFAAAMSTVDSFILMITSSVVRDVYQRSINPRAPAARLRLMSYCVTILVGLVATLGALYPPQFLQYVVVFTGGGLAVAFLGPVALGLYWPQFSKAGAMASMCGGFAVYLGLYAAGFLAYGSTAPIRPFGLDPLIWGFVASLVAAWMGTHWGSPNPESLIRKFFGDSIADNPRGDPGHPKAAGT
ncbi:MAG: hypothetical protein OXU68_12835 [Bacteroidota bacterium]|nr:hypothetical protein [Bacteroidota bacterium]